MLIYRYVDRLEILHRISAHRLSLTILLPVYPSFPFFSSFFSTTHVKGFVVHAYLYRICTARGPIDENSSRPRFDDGPRPFFFSHREKGNFIWKASSLRRRPNVISGSSYFAARDTRPVLLRGNTDARFRETRS